MPPTPHHYFFEPTDDITPVELYRVIPWLVEAQSEGYEWGTILTDHNGDVRSLPERLQAMTRTVSGSALPRHSDGRA